MIPTNYTWLLDEPGPKMIIEGLKLVGIREIVGKLHNPVIMQWAKELNIDNIYTADEIAWCGLAHAYVCLKAGKEPLRGVSMLRALEWAKWGRPAPEPMLSDTLVFKRPGGGHVGQYVGEDSQCYHVMGGNQGNAFGFTRIPKGRLVAARRSYINRPSNVRKIILAPTGAVSMNEA